MPVQAIGNEKRLRLQGKSVANECSNVTELIEAFAKLFSFDNRTDIADSIFQHIVQRLFIFDRSFWLNHAHIGRVPAQAAQNWVD